MIVNIGGGLLVAISFIGGFATFLGLGKVEGSKIQQRDVIFVSFVCLIVGGLILFR